MKKAIISVVAAVGLILVMSVVAISETAEVINAKPEPKTLSLTQAITLAKENNDNIAVAQLAVDSAQIADNAAKKDAKKMDSNVEDYGEKIVDQNFYMAWKILPAQTLEQLNFAKASYDYTVKSIEYGVESAYYGVLKAEMYLKSSQSSVERAETQLANAKAGLKAGTVSKLDTASAESNLLSVKASRDTAKNTVVAAKMSLNQMLGIDIHTPLTLSDKFVFVKVGQQDLAALIAEAINKDAAVRGNLLAANLQKMMYDYQKRYYPESTNQVRTALIDYDNAKIKYDNSKISLEIAVRSAYADLLTAEGNYNSLNSGYELAKEAYRLADLRYKEGLATSYDVINAQNALEQAELGWYDSLFSYNMAKTKLATGVYPAGGM